MASGSILTKINALRGMRRSLDRSRRMVVARQAQETPEIDNIIPFPTTLEEFAEYVTWPHIEQGHKPVRGTGFITRTWFAERTTFRETPDGDMQFGMDLDWKPRRSFFTSGVFDAIMYYMCKRARFRAITVVHVETKNIATELRQQFLYAARLLPEEWTGGVDFALGVVTFRKTGARWSVITAGHSQDVADSIVRSGGVDCIHFTEAGMYRFPAACFSAAKGALPSNGWIVVESTTPRSREHWFARQYFDFQRGVGKFLHARFYPWYENPLKRISSKDPRYKRVMSRKFTESLKKKELEKERSLKLDAEQIAWRRDAFCFGDREDIANNKRENPEDEITAFAVAQDTWLDPDALERIEPDIREPKLRKRFSATLWGAVWETRRVGTVIIGSDCNMAGARYGTDGRVLCAIDGATGEQLGAVWGTRCLDRETLRALEWLLKALGLAKHGPYTVVIEAQAGEGLIGLMLDEGYRARLYREKGKQKPGLRTNRNNRPRYFDRLSEAIEGVDGEPGPCIAVHSKLLLRELQDLVQDETGRPAARQGAHDDWVMALGMALYVRSLTRRYRARIKAKRTFVRPQLRVIHGSNSRAIGENG